MNEGGAGNDSSRRVDIPVAIAVVGEENGKEMSRTQSAIESVWYSVMGFL